MDPIGIMQPVSAQILPAAPAPSVPTALPVPTDSQAKAAADNAQEQQQEFNAQAAEQKRVEAVAEAAKSIANIYVVGDQKFTIYKDTTGQYITRFTSLRDGKVTYIPEPSLIKSTAPDAGKTLNIQA